MTRGRVTCTLQIALKVDLQSFCYYFLAAVQDLNVCDGKLKL